jgi:hypothetical protein
MVVISADDEGCPDSRAGQNPDPMSLADGEPRSSASGHGNLRGRQDGSAAAWELFHRAMGLFT